MIYVVEQLPELLTANPFAIALGIGAAIGGVASGIGTIVGSNKSANAQRATNEANIRLASLQNKWNIEQWQRENAYNSPEAQMQRLKQAGLNPNLAYEKGTVNNVSAHSPMMQRAELQAYTNYAHDYGSAGQQFMSGIGQVLQTMQTKAQTDMLSSQSDYVKAQIESEKLRQIYQQVKNADLKFDFDFKSELRNVNKMFRENELTNLLVQQEGSKIENNIRLANLDSIRLNMSLTREQISKVQEELKYIKANTGKVKQEAIREKLHNDLRRQGINPDDPVVYRIIGRALSDPEYANTVIESIGKLISATAKGASNAISSGFEDWWNNVLDWFK